MTGLDLLAPLVGVAVNVIMLLSTQKLRVSSCTYDSSKGVFLCRAYDGRNQGDARPVVVKVNIDTDASEGLKLLICSVSRVVHPDNSFSLDTDGQPNTNLQPFTWLNVARYSLLLRSPKCAMINDLNDVSLDTHAILDVVSGSVRKKINLVSLKVGAKILCNVAPRNGAAVSRLFVNSSDAHLACSRVLAANNTVLSPSFREALPHELEVLNVR